LLGNGASFGFFDPSKGNAEVAPHAILAGSLAVTITRSSTPFAFLANGNHQTIRREKIMIRGLLPCVVAIAAAVMLSANDDVNADEPLVFISAFAAGDQGAIHAYQLDLVTGQLKQLHSTTDVEHPFFLALSPNNKFLYSIHGKTFGGKENEEVAAYELVGRTGQLKLLNRQSALGTAACYLDVDATGKTVVVANYSTGSVASLPVQTDGSLGEAVTFIQHEGSSVNPSRQKGPHAHCIVISPDNRFVYAADLGLDQVLGYRLDPAKATLAPNQQPFVKTPPGAGPRHLTFHPNGKHVYVINELLNSVTLFGFDSESGMLAKQQTISTLPKDFEGTSYCADLKITPNGRFLYGTNRGHDSIAVYEIGDAGRLTLLGIEPSLGKGPQNLAITAGGELLLCANMPGNNVAVFRIDPNTGSLKSVGEPISTTSPSCIMIR
jgi:6-phosphogluconolactonase